ncbi:MAG TPA: response regulator [Bacillota bacterium]
MSILVVDDSPLVRAVLSDYLREAGFEVYEAGTCREAELQFQQHHSGLVLKDLYMPEWDAIESIRFFRNLDPQVKVVICSTDSSKATILEGLKAGAQDFLLKPFDKDQVLSLIKRLA